MQSKKQSQMQCQRNYICIFTDTQEGCYSKKLWLFTYYATKNDHCKVVPLQDNDVTYNDP